MPQLETVNGGGQDYLARQPISDHEQCLTVSSRVELSRMNSLKALENLERES